MIKKLNFNCNEEFIKRFEQLIKDTNSATQVELFKKSIALYEYINKMGKEGYCIHLKKKGEGPLMIPTDLL